MKTHWKKLTNPDYIGAYSLEENKDLNVTIEKVVRELVTGNGGKKEECTVAYLKGQKPFIINRTNARTITKIANSPYIEDWVNLSITLYVATTKLKGEDVECLRVRESAPKKETLTSTHPKYKAVLEALKSGNYTINQVKAKYDISSEVEKELLKN